MKKFIILLFALALALTACSSNGESGGDTGGSSGDRVLNVCGWGENIDPDLITKFQKDTGIRVNYQTAESNETMYAVIKQGGSDYDVIVPSDYMIGQMIAEDMLAELDFSKIPNYSLVGSQYKNLPFDPDNKYAVPYTWGTLGIIYNTTMIDGEITSWSALFDTKYEGQVGMIGNPRDAIGAALMYLGYSINTTDEAQIREAYQLIADARDAGVYQGFFMDELYDKMEAGETAICTYYAGDFLSMYSNNSDLRYVVPQEGSNWFVDAMCVLKDAEHKDEAMEWINFICSTDACLANMDFIWYASPNTEALEKYPEYYEKQNGEPMEEELYQVMAAPKEILDNCEVYLNLPSETLQLYTDLWIDLRI